MNRSKNRNKTAYYQLMNKLSLIMGTFGFILILWMTISTLEVAVHTTNTNKEYCNFNLFIICEQLRK